jgi:hypothetical protein
MRQRLLAGLTATCLSACVAAPPPAEMDPRRRPLDSLSGEVRLQEVEADLLVTARERFGQAALDRALAAPTHVIVKRFAGMVPPPPPGAPTNWMPPKPATLLLKENGRWLVASGEGWREAQAAPAGELDRILDNATFWDEAATVLPCPDFGASLLLVKVPQRPRVVRNHLCSSATSTLIGEALQA